MSLFWAWLRAFTAQQAPSAGRATWQGTPCSAEQRAQAAMDAHAPSLADRRAKVAEAIRAACADERRKLARLLEGVAEVSESDPHGGQVSATLRRLAELVRGPAGD